MEDMNLIAGFSQFSKLKFQTSAETEMSTSKTEEKATENHTTCQEFMAIIRQNQNLGRVKIEYFLK